MRKQGYFTLIEYYIYTPKQPNKGPNGSENPVCSEKVGIVGGRLAYSLGRRDDGVLVVSPATCRPGDGVTRGVTGHDGVTRGVTSRE